MSSTMDDKVPETFSEHFQIQFRRFKTWLKPDQADPPFPRAIKTVLKGLALVLLLIFSPVMLIGLFLGFIGLM